MIRFRFRAKATDGTTRKGIVEATTLAAAAEVLRGQQMFIVDLHEVGREGGSMFSFMAKVKVEDVVNFTRQLSTMVSAGLALTNALSILQMQTSPALAKKLEDVLKAIEGGSTFANALASHPDAFSKVYIALIRAGEAAGVLDTVLARLADNMEKQREFRAKTKGALIYPVIVLVGMVAVAIVMMVAVLPKLSVMYQDFGAKLPAITQALMDMSNFMVKAWYFIVAGIFGASYLFVQYRRTKVGLLQTDKLILKTPVFGSIKTMTAMAEYARTLALLLSAGVSLVDALKIVREVMDNEVYGQALDVVVKDVEKGNPLASSLARHEAFPLIISQMSSVGEQTGKLDDILLRLANYFETESEHMVKNLSTAMEPIIMMILGMVGIYIGKVFEKVKERPTFIVAESKNL